MDRRRITLILMVALLSLAAGEVRAQSDDFGVWTSINAKKKLSKAWTLYAEGEMRTRDALSEVERWSGNVGVAYRITSWLKADAGYTFLYSNNPTETTKKGNIIPSYWYARHRTTVSLTGELKWKRFTFSLRERWQYTYRPEKWVEKYDGDDGERKDDEQVKEKHKHQLRSRLQVEYNIARSRFTPFAACELYHGADGLEKTRWTLGSEYKINKRHAVEAFYRFQNEADEDDTDMHVLGVGYTFKF